MLFYIVSERIIREKMEQQSMGWVYGIMYRGGILVCRKGEDYLAWPSIPLLGGNGAAQGCYGLG
jgi:hypothetical protein